MPSGTALIEKKPTETQGQISLMVFFRVGMSHTALPFIGEIRELFALYLKMYEILIHALI